MREQAETMFNFGSSDPQVPEGGWRARADRYRRLAELITDRRALALLEEMARECDARALAAGEGEGRACSVALLAAGIERVPECVA
jgi:hypothetical protein